MISIDTALRNPVINQFQQQLAVAHDRYEFNRSDFNRYQLVICERRLAAAIEAITA